MELFGRFVIKGTCLIIKNSATAVVSDLHLGFSDYLNERGILSYFDESKGLKWLLSACEENGIKRLILNGDILHDFSKLRQRVEKRLDWLISSLDEKGIKCDLVEGNHDNLLRFFLDKRGIKAKKKILAGDVFITHGDKLFRVPEKAKYIVIGHEHPAVEVEEKRFKAYLVSEYEKRHLIVMPSFFGFREGSENKGNPEKPWSPFIKGRIKKRIIVEKAGSEHIAVPF
jgi:hypothetical protein